ncbi:hypothetical protein V8E55_004586 [Tylopilus felleus]
MPLVSYVIDDKSPLISYDATWLPGNAYDDTFATDYYLGTFTTNNVTDGVASFNFNGTSIWIYGANRPNHGSYTVQVDGSTYSGFNGAGNNLFQQSLFNVSTLNQGMHSVKLTNTASNSLYVDIDMIVWQSEVGNTDDQLLPEIIQDADSRFQYQEPAWSTSSPSSNFNFALFNNGTGHITQTYDATVTFTFTGEAISLFGTSGPSNGPYSTQLDGGQTVQYNATNTYPTNYGVMIYHADNIGPGSHRLVLTNLPASNGQSLTIDYAQLWTIASSTTTSPSPNSDVVSQDKLSSGAIAGIAIVAVIAAICAGAAFFFYRRWKAAMATQHDLYRAYTLQGRFPGSATAAPTGISSSLETRSNANLLRNDATAQAFSGRAPQLDGATPIVTGSRDSRSIIDTVSSPTQSAMDEGLGRRLLPEAPGGGLSVSDEFPRHANARRPQSMTTVNHSSIAAGELPPPNYNQATGGGG